MADPTFTRANTAKGPTSAGVTQTTIVPTYTAAAAGGVLVAVVFLSTSQTVGAGTITGPGGNWSQFGSTLANNNINLGIAFFQNSAVDASTSATFTVSNGTPFAVVYEFNLTSGIDSTKIFSASTGSSTGSTATTGSGTAQEINDYQLIGGMMGDANFTNATTTAGFTKDLSLADHGDSSHSFGGSAATFHKNAVNSSTTVSSNTITWSGAAGVGLGFTLLMRPIVAAAFGLYPREGAYPGGQP